MRTLLATDGSVYATTALTAASRLLTHAGNRFGVACVIPDYSRPSRLYARSPGLEEWLRSKYRKEMKDKTENVLREAHRILREEGIDANTFTETGSPADVLVRLGAEYDAIVIGSQSQGERPGPGLGPVASRIVEHVSGIVLVGRPLVNERNFRILIAVDGSTSSINALETLRTSFGIQESEVTLIHVIEKPWLRLGLEQDWHDDFESSYLRDESGNENSFRRELQVEAEQILDHARARLSRHCLAVETEILEGNPGNELLSEAEAGEYDLAVVGATGASDLKHTLLGSVSFKLACSAPCSVAVIR
jgi:nucleotide-binding universal stress UspA family protein